MQPQKNYCPQRSKINPQLTTCNIHQIKRQQIRFIPDGVINSPADNCYKHNTIKQLQLCQNCLLHCVQKICFLAQLIEQISGLHFVRTDDQDSGWVSVSSGTGSPGSPGQRAVKRLCVFVTINQAINC